MRSKLALLAVIGVVLGACDGGGTVLVVDLKTDYVPGRQFVGVRTEVGDPDLTSIFEREDTIATSGDYLSGARIAELSGLAPGTAAVRVSLIDAMGGTIASRTTIVEVAGSHALTVLITSACEGVTCPGGDDDPTFTACVGGRCVDPRCSPQNPELCGDPQCTNDAQCSSPVDCADALCLDGACFVRVDDSRCGASEECRPTEGCVLRADVDAGPGCPPVETACADGEDEDCDGQTDCEDPDCADATCDDGDACTEDDTCSAGACTGTALECDDGNLCTDDACDPASGCTFTNNTAGCDDGDACTENDACSGGACAGTTLECDDANPCTDDSCDPASGCAHANNTTSCDDGFWCNGPDRCSGGLCMAEGPSPCPAFCNETSMTCEECVLDSDCGAVSYGAWSTCAGFGGTCDESGTQSRSVMTPQCESGMCTVATSSESRACTRDTDGTSCGTTTYSTWSSCGGYANACDESGTQSRTRTDRRCAAGSCASQNTMENRSCSRRVADGTSCGGTWRR